jgi:hypothetical protein
MVSLALILMLLLPAAAAQAATQGCYYDPGTLLGIGCTGDDMAMIGLKTGLALTAASGDVDTYFALRRQAVALEKQSFSLSVKLAEPLGSYRVLDAAVAGPNIRFATIPSRSGPRLLITDRLWNRPIRVTEGLSAGLLRRRVDWTVSYTFGCVITDIGEYLVRGETGGLAGALTGGMKLKPVFIVDGASGSGVTEFQVDVLHTDPAGNRTIYRKRVFVSGNGHIRVDDAGRPWAPVRQLFPGDAW